MIKSLPHLFLRGHLRCCYVEGAGYTFVDLRTQQYLALPHEFEHAFGLATGLRAWPGSNTISADIFEKIDELTRSNILTAQRDDPLIADVPPTPARDSVLSSYQTLPATSPSWSAFKLFLSRFHCVRQLMIRANFLEMLRYAKTASLMAASCEQDEDDKYVGAHISRFRAMRLWTYTAESKCLFDSLLLHAYLAAHRIGSNLVIGVSFKPFGAHAWVQKSDVVLNDRIGRVLRYTPILTL